MIKYAIIIDNSQTSERTCPMIKNDNGLIEKLLKKVFQRLIQEKIELPVFLLLTSSFIKNKIRNNY